ncbi:nonribosomal peptide synthase [Patellaria atrata CBS 101060]|uniref:Nonribosomal peptide synthase n=1 Tax=Patellaria atrata CBS 101060 TaxID=1346257 RepID=A0A9P4VWP9_9PEZI|nr:nonribosomal peptide synthase [Patellaria atrata CBS 101060]
MSQTIINSNGDAQSYWKDVLASMEPCNFPPLDGTTEGPTRSMSLKVDLSCAAKLEELAAKDEHELANALLSGWALAIRCYTGLENVCFEYQEIGEDATNVSALRLRLEQTMTLSALTDCAARARNDGNAHAVESASRMPRMDAYNTAFTYKSAKAASAREAKVGLSQTGDKSTKLRLQTKVTQQRVTVFLEWDSSFLSAEQAANVARTFDAALTDLLEHPESSIASIDCVGGSSRRQMLKWNSEPLVEVRRCVHEIFRERAVSQPNAEAISAWDGSFTYRELDQVATRLAQQLRELGVGPEVFVPLVFDKSKWNVVAMLATMYAGGAFVPLDPASPLSRLQELAGSVNATVLLCSRQHRDNVATVAQIVFPVDQEAVNQLPAAPETTFDFATCDNAAYLIFTSGSTGMPKSTVLTHSAFCSSSMAHGRAQLQDSPETRILQFAAHTFDASLVEILTPLLHGGCCCIPSESDRLNDIENFINNHKVNWAVLTPSFVEFLNPSAVPGIKTLVLAGEAMAEHHIRTWTEAGVRLVNGYGPSECAVCSVANNNVTLKTGPKNIGHPVGVHCWVVDPEDVDRLVPIGCIGELIIEGHTLSRGYLNDSAKTAEAFIQNPAWATASADGRPRRMYRTGDLVRYSSNGSIYFVGRKDTQVKLHGQRIELGEIEHHLNADDDTSYGLVLLPKQGFYKERLVSVLSLKLTSVNDGTPLRLLEGPQMTEAASTIEGIRARLLQRLPEYMVPTTFLAVEAMPFLPSGKLDRKKISNWLAQLTDEVYRQVHEPMDEDEFSATPANDTESTIRLVWGQVLNLPLEQVKLDRSFLSHSGDSITALSCKAQCQKRGITLQVQDILKSKSIRELARRAKATKSPSFIQEDVEEPFDLSPIQKLFFSMPDQGRTHFNQSFFLKTTRKLKEERLSRALETLLSVHSMLRARFSKSGPQGQWQQRVTNDIAGSYRLRTYAVASVDEASSAIEKSQQSLNPEVGPIFAADLIEVDGGEQLLFMTGHHLCIDLVSWRVILGDLEELLTNTDTSASLSKPMPFQAWSKQQAEHARSLSLSRVLPVDDVPAGDGVYWGMDGVPNLYGDVLRQGFELDSSTTSKLMSDCHQALRTETVDLLLSALIHGFAQTFTDRDVAPIYNEGHGREIWNSDIDLSRTVGWFTTMYPLYVPGATSSDIIDIVKGVKDFRKRLLGNGRPYFASRLLTPAGDEKFHHHWPLELTFNYLGQYQQLERQDALLRPVEEMAGEARGAGGTADVGHLTPRFGLFEISAVIAAGKLRFSFTFNRHMKHQQEIYNWVSTVEDSLKVISQRLVQMQPEPTLSDYPLMSLNRSSLQELITQRLPAIGIRNMSEIEDIYPCSAMQQGLLLSQTKDAGYYAVQITCEAKHQQGSMVNAGKLTAAWQKVVNRHALLRTVFLNDSNNGMYDQVVFRTIDAPIVQLESNNTEHALQMLKEQRTLHENAGTVPHRFTVCRVGNQQTFFKLEMGHTIMDGTSMSVLLRDLKLAYEDKLEASGPLYSEYIAYLQQQPFEEGIEYWKSYLRDVEPCQFPILNDGLPKPRQLHSIRVGFKNMSALQQICQKYGVTLSNAFHTAWALTLRSYTGSDGTCFGYLISGRDIPIDGIEEAVGPFINMLVCRVDMPSKSSIVDVMSQVQKDYTDSIPHRYTSLAEVQHALKLGGTALFNTALSYRRLPPDTDVVEPGVSFTECAPTFDPTEYDVSINVEVADHDAYIDLDYYVDYLSDGQASNVANTFVQALENIIQQADTRIEKLDGLSENDRHQIMSWNSQMPPTINKCVHEIVQERVLERPQASAVEGWDAKFTYVELNKNANLLAQYLMNLGVGAETLVPACFDKSAYTVVAMLAIMKAGGVVVPLGANHPKSALEDRVQDTQASIVLASTERAPIFDDVVPTVVAVNAELLKELAAEYGLVENPARNVVPENGCFIIFTSGSTGKPKGVVLEHRALATSHNAHGTALGLGPHSRVLQFASHTFDNSIEEMFTTLTRGGTVCVPSEHDRMNDLAGVITRLNCNFMDLTPTVANTLVPSDVPSIKSMALGGEAITKRNADTWGKAVQLHGQYGPSECSINCVWNGDIGASPEPTNIGRAVGSVSWVVHPRDHNLLMPVGAAGELLVEGPILARGYLNNPEKTAEVFIENPLWASASKDFSVRRFYKTGDLVRYNSDGTLTYLGRKDTQVKLHGQRIELGEIEHNVKQSLTLDGEVGVELVKINGVKALAAFLCLPDAVDSEVESIPGLLPMTDSLRSIVGGLEQALSDLLPTYMIPSLFIPVAEMPLTTSGKLDRRALRLIAEGLSEQQSAMYRLAGGSGRAPTTDMEIALQELWGSVLPVDAKSIGADDGFFRLGGDSIAAISLVTAARKKGISLTVATIFQKPKLSDMANHCTFNSAQEINKTEAPAQPFALLNATASSLDDIIHELAQECNIETHDVQDIYPCSPLQAGLVALSNKQDGAYVAQNTYRLPSDIDIERFQEAWRRVAQSEAILRTRVVHTKRTGFVQVVIREDIHWNTASTFYDLSEDSNKLQLGNGGRLTNFALVGPSQGAYHFVWTIHHALYDGWCIDLMLQKVKQCYEHSKITQSAPYSSFIRHLTALDNDASDDFWISKLSESSSRQFPQLPSPAYAVSPTSLLTHTMLVPQKPSPDVTLPSAIRAAWALIVAAYSGSDDVLFGEILTGRDAQVDGIESIVGPTLTTIPARFQVNRDLNVEDFLREVQNSSVEAMPYQFAGLQHIKQLERKSSSLSCEFQNLLAINSSEDEIDNFWVPEAADSAMAHFYTYPLTIACTIGKKNLSFEAHFDQDIIPNWHVQRLLYQFQSMLELLTGSAAKQVKVGQMALLSSQDKNTIRNWNSSLPQAVTRCIHETIHDITLSKPDSPAIASWDGSYTYSQLDRRSTSLARRLVLEGIRPGDIVPLCFEKSALTIVAMLAVLKTGAAFTSLDPNAPIARLRVIVEEAESRMIVCSPQQTELCKNIMNKVYTYAHESSDECETSRTSLPAVNCENTAYAIFTSGSTGTPKGVLVSHKAFCTGAAWHGPALRIGSDTRALQFASYTFDASLLEIFTTLSVGGCVCVPDDTRRMNDITGVINELQANWSLLTPSFAQLIQPSTVPTLRTLALGGEAMSRAHITTWSTEVHLINAYGPSETAVVATANSHVTSTTDPANMGRAVGGRSWVVDPLNHDRLMPIGAIGELCVEGPILASGYLHNEKKTAEVFIQDPKWTNELISGENGNARVKIYKTGDLVKYDADGSLLYLGRKDTQVKLHGQRLELGDIEHHLRTDSLIKHALAAIPTTGVCAKRMVAVLSLQEIASSSSDSGLLHLVAREAAAFNLPEIRDRISGKLPAYMVPSIWAVVQELPLLPSGKLDRRQIITWVEQMSQEVYQQITEVAVSNDATNSMSGASDIELRLQKIWASVLNLPQDQIALNVPFLHLGGDSISSYDVVAQARAENIGLTVQDVIRSKSISALAQVVTLPEEVSYQSEKVGQAFDLSPIQKLFFECVGERFNHFNQSLLLRISRSTGHLEISRAVESIIRAHSMLRARFHRTITGVWQQSISDDVTGSFQFQSHSIGHSSQEMYDLIEKSQKSLNVEQGPLFAVDLFTINGDEYQVMSLIAHHLSIDVVSWRIILRDLEDLLQSDSAKLSASVPFQIWSDAQAEKAQKDVVTSGLPIQESIHSDFSYWAMDEEPNVHGDVIVDEFELDMSMTTSILNSGTLIAEPVDIFIASLIHSFKKVFTDRTAPAIFNEGHGREPWNSMDLSRTIGWFTTLCPIYLPSSAKTDRIVDIVRWVKDFRSRTPGKGRQYFASRMLTDAGKEAYTSHWPMEITFNYLGQLTQMDKQDSLLRSYLPEDSTAAAKAALDADQDMPRFSLFDISAAVMDGQLKFSFGYNRNMRRLPAIANWVKECKISLSDFATQLVMLKPEPTLSDYPLLPLSFDGISKVHSAISEIGITSLEDIEDVYPSSPMQQGLLLSQIKNAELYSYHCNFEIRSTQPGTSVDIGRFAQAWQAVVARHPALRTCFASATFDGAQDQIVLRKATPRISWLESSDENAIVLLNEQQPINCRDLQPPHRMIICKTDSQRVFCRLEISHAISDGTSMPILLRDIMKAYSGTLPHDKSGPRYSDYIAYLQSISKEADINYWKTYLTDIEPCNFPAINDKAEGAGELKSVTVNLGDNIDLQSFCTKHGLTVSNVLQFAWALVLRHYTGSNEICFGYLTSGRDVPVAGIQEAIGAFINMLICRVNFNPEVSVSDTLDKIQSDFVASMSHQTCSLADVQHELGLSGTALFNTAYSFQKRVGGQDSKSDAIDFDVLDAHDPSEYSVTVNVEQMETGTEVSFSYWSTHLSETQAENLANTFHHITNTITQRHVGTRAIKELDCFGKHGKQQVLSWNKTLPAKVNKCVHQAIKEQARLRPASAQAICAWDVELTFTELEESAIRLAHHLRSLGVRPGVFVPLCFEKTGYAIVSMMAVNLAGGAFVPLDFSHPVSRLKNLIDNVKASAVLCSPKHAEKVSSAAPLAVPVDGAFIASLPTVSSSLPEVDPDSPSYVIFTSGTTGMPKGTVIEHAAFCTSATEHARSMYMDSSSRVFQFASYTFDASVMEILSTLIVGGCVCVPSEEERMNDIPGAMVKRNVNWTLLTPSVANTLKPESVPTLKVLVTGGEAMSSSHISKWKNHCSIINAYGPSECSVIATTSTKVDINGSLVDSDTSNIGPAVGGRCWVVDPQNHNQLVPVGAVGELVVEGWIVAREYLNDPAKTAAAFISNTTWGPEMGIAKNQRMYKTGDLVRYNSRGQFAFISRKDTQIKLNGQRIELGEIEHNIKACLPDTCQSAVELVVPQGGRSGAKALAVFYTTESARRGSTHNGDKSALFASDMSPSDELLLPMSDGARLIAKNLENSLGGVLPAYMIPSIYVPVAKLPWTSSGKLDRNRLKTMVQALAKETMAPYRLANVASKSKKAPMSELETKLAKLWEIILQLKPGSVANDDNFFRLSGDSVAAMRLVAAARTEGLVLTVINIFRNPKLAEMASACTILEDDDLTVLKPFDLLLKGESKEATIADLASECQTKPEALEDAYPVSALQEGLITLTIKQPGAYVARNVFRLPLHVDINRFKAAWHKVVAEVDILRTRIVNTKAGSFIQVVMKEDPITWNSAPDYDSVLAQPSHLPSRNGGQLQRFTITEIDTAAEARYFIWEIHHALYDGWSMPLVLKRVESAYFNTASNVPKAPYAQFIKYLRLTDQKASDTFWKNKLADSSSMQFPELPHSSAERTHDGRVFSHSAPIKITSGDITMPTVIRAAWTFLIAAYTGADDVVFGETLTGRDVSVPGITDIVGPTLTTVPTRLQLDRSITVKEFLNRIQEASTAAIPYQHAGLQHIKRLNDDTARACDFQNLLVIQTAEGRMNDGLWDPQSSGVGSNFFTMPLVVECRAGPSDVELDIHHDANILSPWQAERLAFQFETVLSQINSSLLEGGNRLVADISSFSPQDQEMISSWNAHEPQPLNLTIHGLFKRIARSQPEAEAICAWDMNLTYRELEDRASALASCLVELGVGRGVLVPVCVDKSAVGIVSYLAVLMANGTFVPLDPSHPIERHIQVFKDTEATILICSPQYQERYASSVKAIIVANKETMMSLPPATSILEEATAATPDDTAYGIYTSGSTGNPKAVMVSHNAFVTSSEAYRTAMLMEPNSRVFQFASYTFDVGLMEVFTTLTYGGCVCSPSEDERTRNVGGALASLACTWAFLTPSVASIIDPSAVPSMRVLVTGGEAMSIETVTMWADKLTLVNGYGPTEAAVIAVVNNRVSEQKDPSNIGKGHGTCIAWITDANNHDRLAPVGCIGELILEGPILAKEYLNNPEKTASSFIDAPSWQSNFARRDGQQRRIYKTGDLVKYNEDGSFMFLGRKDNQVKLNGQRLELGEIEHRLEISADVRHAVVVMPKKGPCSKRLVAVVAFNGEEGEDTSLTAGEGALVCEENQSKSTLTKLSKARRNVADHLPPYMVPTVWVPVNAIPLLVSGKLDRKQVERWVISMDETTYDRVMGYEEDEDSAAPTTATSKLLQTIWSKVLNIPIERVKPNRSFMQLGGDSITAMQVVARCRKENITNLSLHDVLRSKGVAQLALVAGTGHQISYQEEKVDQDFELSPIQQLYMQCAGNLPRGGHFNQSFSLKITQKAEGKTVLQAIKTIVSQHSMLRSRFRKQASGEWRQRITTEVDSSFRFREINVPSKEEIIPGVEDSQKCLDVIEGPVFAVDLYNINGGEQMIFLAAHHLIIDMVSWRVILGDLEEFLKTNALSEEKGLSFQTWLCLQQDRAQRMVQKGNKVLPFKIAPAEMAFWGMDTTPNTYADVISEGFAMDKALTEPAIQGCHSSLRTEPIDLFLAVLSHAFSRIFTDRNTPTVYNEGHGREVWDTSIDLTRTIGWFTTICPVHVPIDREEDDVVETVRRMKDLRRQVPGNGRDYFAHRYLTAEGKWQFADHMPMEIIFNYLGRMQQLEADDSLLQQMDFVEKKEDQTRVSDVGANTPRMALFEISTAVMEDKIQFTFLFNKKMKHQDRIRQWLKETERLMRQAVKGLMRVKPEPTLADYPLLPITYEGIKKLVDETFPKHGISHHDEIEDIYPCAPMQEGLLLAQLKDPRAYLFNTIFDLSSPKGEKIDGRRLLKAWQKVVDRHPALRTLFVDSVYKGGVFDQIVIAHAESGALFYECENYEEAFKKLDNIHLTETQYLEHPRLPHQFTACQTKDGQVLMKLEINHAVIDGGSASNLLHDIAAAYEDRLTPGSGPLYSDYISYIRSGPPSADVKFWKEYLYELQPCYFPVINTAQDALEQKRLASVAIKFDRFAELQTLCENRKVTMSNIMQATWAMILRKYTGAQDVCFGYLTSGRDVDVKGIQEAVGAFINMLVCRVQFTASATLADVFQRVQNDFLDSLPYQHCSLAQVQHDLGLAGKPLFNTAVSIQNHSMASDAAEETIIFEPTSAHDPSEYVLTVNIETARNDEGVVFRYWTNIVSDAQAEQIAADFAQVLSGIIDEPDQAVIQVGKPQEVKMEQVQVPEKTPVVGMDAFEMTALLRSIVKECVGEVIQQMFKDGELVRYNKGGVNDIGEEIGEKIERTAIKRVQTIKPEEEQHQQQQQEIKAVEPIPPTTVEIEPRDVDDLRKKVASLWSTVLEVPEATIENDDSFFAAGGDSILAMNMVGMAREQGLPMIVADIFRNPVFEELVNAVANNQLDELAESGATAQAVIDLVNDQKPVTTVVKLEHKSYEPFSLLRTNQVEDFLQDHICPRIHVFRGGVADVYPVTDFQGLAVTGALLESKWMLNCFYLEGNGDVDVAKLKRSLYRVVESFDILRTVFLSHEDQFLQVVLRHLKPEFSVVDTDQDLAEFTSELYQASRKNSPKMGESYVQFTLVKHKGSKQHRILMRISHAQYDGVCLPRILMALQEAYVGNSIPSTPPFATFVRSSTGEASDASFKYWKNLLQGSKMTNIIQRPGPNYTVSATTTIKRVATLPSLSSVNVTPATVIKAAWAVTLAQLSANSDIVFGHVISGRNANVSGVDKIVGPCLNMVPVRVKFQPSWTVLDLLRFVQDQQISNMPFESLGFREITKHCTEWPDWTTFTSVVQHQNIEQGGTVSLGTNEYTLGALGSQDDFADFTIVSTPVLGEPDRIEICLSYPQNPSVTATFANNLLDTLCDLASKFAEEPSADLPSPTEFDMMKKNTLKDTMEKPATTAATADLTGLSKEELLSLSNTLTRAWSAVLRDEKGGYVTIYPTSSFYELGGDIMDLARVAQLLAQDGFYIRIEDLVDHPIMLEQLALLSLANAGEKEKEKELDLFHSNSSSSTLQEPEHIVVRQNSKEGLWAKSVGRFAKKFTRKRSDREVPRALDV